MKKIYELTTYAQNREDLYLYALLSHIEKGFYVDVGANHESLHSVTRMFYELGWSGINIEPNKKLIDELSKKRKRDANLQVGISNKNGKMSFREYPDFDGLSTLSEDIKELYKDRQYNFIDYEIPVKTLKSVLRSKNVKDIDFLKIDVEGHELAVLEGNDWNKFRPKVVSFEGTDGEKCIAFCNKQGYRLEFFDGLNYYMADKNHPEITIHNFAGAVLTKGLYTEREKQLLKSIDSLQRQANILQEQLDKVQKTINNGLGIKNSLKSLHKSAKNKITRKNRVSLSQ